MLKTINNKKKQDTQLTKQQERYLNIELPIDRIVYLQAAARREEKVVSYHYCTHNYFLLEAPIDIEALQATHSSGEPISLGIAVQLTGNNKGMAYNFELRDFRSICNGMVVSAGPHEMQLLYCKINAPQGKSSITLKELIELSEQKTNKSLQETRQAAIEKYKEWGHREY